MHAVGAAVILRCKYYHCAWCIQVEGQHLVCCAASANSLHWKLGACASQRAVGCDVH